MNRSGPRIRRKRQRRPATAPAAVGNALLTALLASGDTDLPHHIERVRLTAGELLYRADQSIDDVYVLRACCSGYSSAYARTFLAVISQSVACNQHHDIEQRLARLLLTMSHYADSREFRMIHVLPVHPTSIPATAKGSAATAVALNADATTRGHVVKQAQDS